MSSSGREVPVNPARLPPEAVRALPPLLGPVRTGNAFEETVERLLAVVKLGLVAPGDRFPAERELAATLGISRLTLREAIRELQRSGYVESRRGRFGGTFVTYRPPVPSQAEAARLARENAARLTDALTFRMAVGDRCGRGPGPLGRAAPRRPGGAARAAGRGQRGQPGGLPAAGHALPPVHRRAGRLAAAQRRLRRGQDADERPAQRDPGDSAAISSTRPASTRPSPPRSWPGTRSGPAGRWRSTSTAPARCCAASWPTPGHPVPAAEPAPAGGGRRTTVPESGTWRPARPGSEGQPRGTPGQPGTPGEPGRR